MNDDLLKDQIPLWPFSVVEGYNNLAAFEIEDRKSDGGSSIPYSIGGAVLPVDSVILELCYYSSEFSISLFLRTESAGKRIVMPEEVSAAVLRHMRDIASEYLGKYVFSSFSNCTYISTV